MADDSAIHTKTDSSQVSDPYVIYQLRKPSQRGTAVIPRYVPNTHVPAFSPANYRFARVWTTNDNNVASPSTLLHVPRSFEYAGSLGSESSFWSDASSWLSVSSLRTAPSEPRAPLLHSNQNPVSAASFFNNDLESPRLRNSFRPSSARSSEIGSPIPSDFRYPPALSESLSEDAVIDDLLSLQKPQFPHLRNHSNVHTTSPDHPALPHTQSSHRNNHSSSQHRSPTPRSNPTRNPLLPTLTHKRRSLWQWLFCTNKAAMSTTVPSVTISQTAAAVRQRVRPTESSLHTPATKNNQTDILNQKTSTKPQSKDRVPKADKDFLDRTRRAADAPAAKSKTARRRNPSFEIRRGKPSGTTKSGRSMSWNFMPKGLLGRDREPQKESKEKKKRKSTGKDKPRHLPTEETKEPRKLHRIVFQRSSTRKARNPGKDSSRDRNPTIPRHKKRLPSVNSRKELPKAAQSNMDRSREHRSREHRSREDRPRGDRPRGDRPRGDRPRGDRPREDRPREDRPREDRPREGSKPRLETMKTGGAPLPKSIVPSLREKQASGKTSQIQRMRSTESSDPVTSRISSDLSSTTYERTNESDSSSSTPIRLRQGYRPPTHELDPAAHGVSSDVSSHASGAIGKSSPAAKSTDQIQDYSALSSPEIRGIDPSIMSRDSPHRAALFAFPSSSSGSGGFTETQSKTAAWDNPPTDYPEYTSTFGNFGSTAPELIAIMDPVARAREKNRARSAGGPLSYLMKQHDPEGDVNTQSTGLTSLADESVSTHKTVSVVGDEYQYRSQLPGGLHGHLYGEGYASSKAQEAHEIRSSGNSGGNRPIFQNYPMHPGRAKSPSHASSGASPKRYHSDWSDPHATDIDVYCQCNCSCVYEEECRRSCELIYGRSPSVSSTPSRHEYQGFKMLPPAIQTNSRHNRATSTDYDNTECEPFALQNGMGSGDGHNQPSKKTYLRANAVDELPDPESERFYSEAYKFSQTGHGVPGIVPGVSAGYGAFPRANGHTAHVNGNAQSSYGRETSGWRAKQDEGSLHHQSSSPHPYGASNGTSICSPRAGRQNEQTTKKTDRRHRHGRSVHEDGGRSGDGKHRSSSGRSGQNGRSGRHQKSRNDGKPDKSSRTGTERRRKDGERRVGHEWAPRRSERTQQMGNSYVVKRSGLPPLSTQAYLPQTYGAGEYERGLDREYIERGGLDDEYNEYRYENGRTGDSEREERVDAVETFGDGPVVELEYEKRGSSGRQNGYQREARQEARQEAIKGEVGKERSRSRHGHKRHHTSKQSSRSRTPVLGVF